MENKTVDNSFDNFEQAMDILKSCVEDLETSNTNNLDLIVKNYEKGLQAYKYCVNLLEKTKNEIKIINNDEI